MRNRLLVAAADRWGRGSVRSFGVGLGVMLVKSFFGKQPI
jgi:hypothetical protein